MRYAWIVPLLVVAGIAGPIFGQSTRRQVSEFSNAQLIDRLVLASNAEFGIVTNLLPFGDFANGAPVGLVLKGDQMPEPGDVMKEIVRRGAAIVPDLVAHIDDTRKTNAFVESGFSGIQYVSKYDWNAKLPPVFSVDRVQMCTDFGSAPSKKYNFAVGDFCFKLIGDIVNRNFDPSFYQPSLNVFVNSPVLCPGLANAIREEWGNLTEEQHRNRLIVDVVIPDEQHRAEKAVELLWKYYQLKLPDPPPKSAIAPDAFRLSPAQAAPTSAPSSPQPR